SVQEGGTVVILTT
nr:immunoglobulin heavy chain junction region [Mus musculus]